jgi:hypothetical protein
LERDVESRQKAAGKHVENNVENPLHNVNSAVRPAMQLFLLDLDVSFVRDPMELAAG